MIVAQQEAVKKEHRGGTSASSQASRQPARRTAESDVLVLQRAAGNRAAGQMLEQFPRAGYTDTAAKLDQLRRATIQLQGQLEMAKSRRDEQENINKEQKAVSWTSEVVGGIAGAFKGKGLRALNIPDRTMWDASDQLLKEVWEQLTAGDTLRAAHALQSLATEYTKAYTELSDYLEGVIGGAEISTTGLKVAAAAGAIAATVATGGIASGAAVPMLGITAGAGMGLLGTSTAIGVGAGVYGLAQETATQSGEMYAGTRKAWGFDYKTILARGGKDAVLGFVGAFAGGVLGKYAVRYFGSIARSRMTPNEVLAVAERLGVSAGDLTPQVFLSRGQQFLIDFFGGAATTPLTAAVEVVLNRLQGQEWPSSPEAFGKMVVDSAVQGGLVQLFLAPFTHGTKILHASPVKPVSEQAPSRQSVVAPAPTSTRAPEQLPLFGGGRSPGATQEPPVIIDEAALGLAPGSVTRTGPTAARERAARTTDVDWNRLGSSHEEIMAKLRQLEEHPSQQAYGGSQTEGPYRGELGMTITDPHTGQPTFKPEAVFDISPENPTYAVRAGPGGAWVDHIFTSRAEAEAYAARLAAQGEAQIRSKSALPYGWWADATGKVWPGNPVDRFGVYELPPNTPNIRSVAAPQPEGSPAPGRPGVYPGGGPQIQLPKRVITRDSKPIAEYPISSEAGMSGMAESMSSPPPAPKAQTGPKAGAHPEMAKAATAPVAAASATKTQQPPGRPSQGAKVEGAPTTGTPPPDPEVEEAIGKWSTPPSPTIEPGRRDPGDISLDLAKQEKQLVALRKHLDVSPTKAVQQEYATLLQKYNARVAAIEEQRWSSLMQGQPAMGPEDMYNKLVAQRGFEHHLAGHELEAAEARLANLEAHLKKKPTPELSRDYRRLRDSILISKLGTKGAPAGAGYNTYAIVQVVGADGKIIAVATGKYTGGQHAEQIAIVKLEQQFGETLFAGAKIVVVGDKVVCSDICRPALERFATKIKAEQVEGHVFRRLKVSGTGEASEKTTARTSTVDVGQSQGGKPAEIKRHSETLFPKKTELATSAPSAQKPPVTLTSAAQTGATAAQVQGGPSPAANVPAAPAQAVSSAKTQQPPGQSSQGANVGAVPAAEPSPAAAAKPAPPSGGPQNKIPMGGEQVGKIPEPLPVVNHSTTGATTPSTASKGDLRASHYSPQPFEQLRRQSGQEPTSGAGAGAAAGAGQLLIEIEQVLQRESAYRDSRRAGSLRTLHWWLQRGVQPSVRGVTDRWFLWSGDDYTPGVPNAVQGAKEGRFNGIEVDRLDDPRQYEAFGNWANAHVQTWDDFYRHFISNEDAGVRWNGSRWELVTWKWGDWPPANVAKEHVQDDRVTAIMEPIRQRVFTQTQREIEDRAKEPATPGQGASFSIVGVRRFKKGRGTLYSPIRGTPVRYWNQWEFEPLFYEVAGVPAPEGYVFVSGADLRTYAEIYHLRAYYDRWSGPSATIESSERPQYSERQPFTSYGPINLPVILAKKEALVDRSK